VVWLDSGCGGAAQVAGTAVELCVSARVCGAEGIPEVERRDDASAVYGHVKRAWMRSFRHIAYSKRLLAFSIQPLAKSLPS
jgi:hypothetical protein